MLFFHYNFAFQSSFANLATNMSLPLGISYASIGASSEPADDFPFFWKRPRFKRALSKKRRSVEFAGSLFRAYRRIHSEQPDHSAIDPSVLESRRPSRQTKPSPCTSIGFSSSRTSTVSSNRHSLSNFLLHGGKPLSDSSSIKTRHVEILIPDWAIPVQRFSSSRINLPFETETPDPLQSPTNMAQGRTNTIDSQSSAPYLSASHNSSQTSLQPQDPNPQDGPVSSARAPGSGISQSPAMLAGLTTPTSTAGLAGLVCNVHRTTGKEPHPLVGATTTILADKLYVFGGRRLSRTRPLLTSDLYELDLVKRRWSKVETKGDIPPPRYFHSVCPLGDTKLVCYGGT